jgi:thioesterase domain-containing protein
MGEPQKIQAILGIVKGALATRAEIARAADENTDIWKRARMLTALQQRTVGDSSVVEIQPKGTRPALFLVHGVGGGMLWGYHNLAREMSDQPVYAFKSRGLAGLEEFATIEEIAAQYVRDLREFQPTGPYYLGGYCFGGNVAYEMARRLLSEGCEVGPLLLINSWPHNSSYGRHKWTPWFLVKFFWNLSMRMRHQFREGARQPCDYFKWRTAWVCSRAKALVSQRLENEVGLENRIELAPGRERERKLWRTHTRAWSRFKPKGYSGDIVLFRTPGHPLVCSFDPEMGWSDFVSGKILVKMCRGDHDSILEDENIVYTARQVEAALREFQKPTLMI